MLYFEGHDLFVPTHKQEDTVIVENYDWEDYYNSDYYNCDDICWMLTVDYDDNED